MGSKANLNVSENDTKTKKVNLFQDFHFEGYAKIDKSILEGATADVGATLQQMNDANDYLSIA